LGPSRRGCARHTTTHRLVRPRPANQEPLTADQLTTRPGPVSPGQPSRAQDARGDADASQSMGRSPQPNLRRRGGTRGHNWPAGRPHGGGTQGPKRVGPSARARAEGGGAGAGPSPCRPRPQPICMPWSMSTAAVGWPPKSCRPRPGSAAVRLRQLAADAPAGRVPVTNGLVPAAWSASIWVREPASLVGLAPAGSLCRRNL
jgi:hypothetical protein